MAGKKNFHSKDGKLLCLYLYTYTILKYTNLTNENIGQVRLILYILLSGEALH